MMFKLDNYFYLKNRSWLSHNGLQLAAGAGKEAENFDSEPTRAKAIFKL